MLYVVKLSAYIIIQLYSSVLLVVLVTQDATVSRDGVFRISRDYVPVDHIALVK